MTPIPMLDRRRFVVATSVLAAGAPLPNAPRAQSSAPHGKTVGDAIDLLVAQAKGGPRQGTVDTLKTGQRDQPLHGIVTTFLPNVEVIRETIKLGAKLIVSHEPTFYNHFDETDWLEENPVYQNKRRLLDDNGIAVFRYHDYIHDIDPDPIRTTIAEKLGWAGLQSSDSELVYELPGVTLAELVESVAQALGLQNLRFVGEIHEWETSEYVRDANAMGKPLALIVLGHQPSEEAGMAWLASWLEAPSDKCRSRTFRPEAHFTIKSEDN